MLEIDKVLMIAVMDTFEKLGPEAVELLESRVEFYTKFFASNKGIQDITPTQAVKIIKGMRDND